MGADWMSMLAGIGMGVAAMWLWCSARLSSHREWAAAREAELRSGWEERILRSKEELENVRDGILQDLESLLGKNSELVAERDALQNEQKQLVQALLVSERRRLEVGAVIEGVCKERDAWRDRAQTIEIGCAHAQSMLWGEIEALARRAGCAPSPKIQQVLQAVEHDRTQPVPPVTSTAQAKEAIAAIHAQASAELAASPAGRTTGGEA